METINKSAPPPAPVPPHAEIERDAHGAPKAAIPAAAAAANGFAAAPLPVPSNSAATVELIRNEGILSATAPLQVQRLSDKARLPTRGSVLAAGVDLYCAKETTIAAGGRGLVPTDIAIAVPPGTYGRVAPRSGLSVKKGLHAGAGVIDADYRGHVMVLLYNLGQEEVVVQEGERCAQLILERCVNSDVVDVTESGGLKETVRGAGGFGSTGV